MNDSTAVEYMLFKVSNTIKIMFGRKLYSEDELKMMQRSGKITYALWLEELILLKGPYCSKQSTI